MVIIGSTAYCHHCMCVCVRGREGGREKEREGRREREGGREGRREREGGREGESERQRQRQRQRETKLLAERSIIMSS